MGNLILTSSVLMRRNRQRAVGFFDVNLLKSGEDYDFHLRTCRLGDVGYLDLSSVRYRIGASDQLTSHDLMIWIARNDLKTLTKVLSGSREEIHLSNSVIQKRLAQSYAWIGMEEFSQGSKNAIWYFLKSLKLSPFQSRVAAFCLLSVLPNTVTRMLRAMKRIVASVRNHS